MRFLSNFGCRIIFMRSVNFWHQQDSNSLFKEALVTWPLSASGLFSFEKQKKIGSSCISFCGGSKRTRYFSNFTAPKFLSENFDRKSNQKPIMGSWSNTRNFNLDFYSATPLVAHKMVTFAPKTNLNVHVWDFVPYPTKFFYPLTPKSVRAGVRWRYNLIFLDG